MRDKHVSDKVLIGGIIISMFLWGLSWPSGKVLTNYSTAVNFAVYRYIIVAASLFLMLLIFGFQFRLKKEGIPGVVGAGLLLGLYSYILFKGLKSGSAGAGGVLVTTMNPVMAYMIGIILSRKLPSRNEAIGLLLGLIAGSMLLRVWDHSSAILDSGNLYFLLAAFLWALMSKLTAKGAMYGSSLSFSFWQYIITLLCLLPLMDVHEFVAAFSIRDPLFWGNLFFSSAIVTTIATTVYFYSTTRLGAEKASSYIFMVPLAAAVSSWALLGEMIQTHTIVGGLIGIAAVYMINKKPPVKPVAR